jgi:hypothetical protein
MRAHRAHKVLRGRRAFPCRHDLFDHLTMLGDPKDRNREEESLERMHYDDGHDSWSTGGYMG